MDGHGAGKWQWHSSWINQQHLVAWNTYVGRLIAGPITNEALLKRAVFRAPVSVVPVAVVAFLITNREPITALRQASVGRQQAAPVTVVARLHLARGIASRGGADVLRACVTLLERLHTHPVA